MTGQMSDVLRATTDYFRIPAEVLFGRTQGPTVVSARHVVWYLEREKGLSFPAIARMYDRNHTTILAAVRHVTERLAANDPRYAPPIRAIRATLDGSADVQAASGHDTGSCSSCGALIELQRQMAASLFELQRQVADIHRRLTSTTVEQQGVES